MDKINLPEPFGLLMGGVEKGALTNFYGAPGTGKTNICILATVEAISNGGKVIYIDTEGGLSRDRLLQITGNPQLLEKIILAEPKNFKEQGRIIKSLATQEADLVILDSAVALYRLECAYPDKETIEAAKELSVQLSMLSNLARDKNIPVVITAHTFRNWDTGENKVIGGDSIKYWSKSIIFIEKTPKLSERKATVVKHRSIPEGKEAKFMIVENGIKPSGFKIF